MGVVYRPSAAVTLAFRAEEYSGTRELRERLATGTGFSQLPEGADPATSAAKLTELNERLREALQRPESPERDEEARSIRAEMEATNTARLLGPGAAPQSLQGGDERFGLSGIQPRAVSVARNGFREADTATIELDWKDVPFDPRVVRACGVEILLGVISAENFARGFEGQRNSRGQLLSIIDSGLNASQIPGSATRFVGWVDDWSVTYSEDGDRVSLECRDWTAPFLDTPVRQGDGVDLNLPITEGIQKFIDGYASVRGIPVIWGDTNQSPNVKPPVPGEDIPPASKAKGGKVAKAKQGGSGNPNLWDHITDVCLSTGIIPVMRDYELRIIEPRTLNKDSRAKARAMVFGKNLSELSFGRLIGGSTEVNPVEVHAVDNTIDRTRFARWPVGPDGVQSGIIGVTPTPKPTIANQVPPSGQNVDEKYLVYVLTQPNVNPRALERAARNLYEEVSRQEIEGSFTTRDASSWDLGEGEPFSPERADLLTLRTGEPVQLLIAAQNPTSPEIVPSTAAEIASLSLEARVNYLVDKGYAQEVAQQVAALQEASGFVTVFRTRSVNIEMDRDDGLSISVDFINYIVIRDEGVDDRELAEETPTSASLERRLGSSETEPAKKARAAQRKRRAVQKKRAKGEATDAELMSAIEEEQTAIAWCENPGDGVFDGGGGRFGGSGATGSFSTGGASGSFGTGGASGGW